MAKFEAPLAGLLAHSAEATGSQLISAQRTVRVSDRWSGYGPVAVCDVRSWGHGPLGLGIRLRAKSRRLGNLRSSMGDRDQEKNMENPDTVQKVRGGLGLHQTERTVLVIAPWLCPRDTSLDLAVHNRTASLDTGRLCGWFDSHHRLGGWAKRLVMSQKARVAKSHELPKVVSCQRSRVTKGCEMPQGLVSDPYGSVYDLLSQDRFTVCLSQGPRPDQVRKSVGPLSRTSIGPVKPRFYPVRRIGLRSDPELFVCSVYLFWTVYLILNQGVELRMVLVKPRSREGSVSERLCNVWLDDARDELVIELRMVLVKPRSREGSVSERLCNVWLDDARDELVIVYETVKKLCIGSHVSK
ncbi:hypothetical protein F2Q70_00008763 [Brassica cretica]|uniref:Uncharacterized protein n=1 Tax=Brassica cretica TaxID=69181 RepID=A0A8S9M092_BRACR|nr:hypothetical protein F2Q70_00008763 [Brassica cretica]